MRSCSWLLRRLEQDQNKCPLYGIAGCPLLRGFEYTEVYNMEMQSGHTKLSVILQVSALRGVR